MKIICIGRNYSEHAEELGNNIPQEPVIFMKPDTALLKGHDFYIPDFSDNIHYELEVVLKISKNGKYIQKKHAHHYYDEFALGIDFTARDLQSDLKEKGLPWEIAKAFDGSAAVSKFYPKTEYPLENLSFSLHQNNQKVQEGNSHNMIFSFDTIIEFISKFFTLRKGDLIFTGTPKGVSKVAESDVLDLYLEEDKILSIRIF